MKLVLLLCAVACYFQTVELSSSESSSVDQTPKAKKTEASKKTKGPTAKTKTGQIDSRCAQKPQFQKARPTPSRPSALSAINIPKMKTHAEEMRMGSISRNTKSEVGPSGKNPKVEESKRPVKTQDELYVVSISSSEASTTGNSTPSDSTQITTRSGSETSSQLAQDQASSSESQTSSQRGRNRSARSDKENKSTGASASDKKSEDDEYRTILVASRSASTSPVNNREAAGSSSSRARKILVRNDASARAKTFLREKRNDDDDDVSYDSVRTDESSSSTDAKTTSRSDEKVAKGKPSKSVQSVGSSPGKSSSNGSRVSSSSSSIRVNYIDELVSGFSSPGSHSEVATFGSGYSDSGTTISSSGESTPKTRSELGSPIGESDSEGGSETGKSQRSSSPLSGGSSGKSGRGSPQKLGKSRLSFSYPVSESDTSATTPRGNQTPSETSSIPTSPRRIGMIRETINARTKTVGESSSFSEIGLLSDSPVSGRSSLSSGVHRDTSESGSPIVRSGPASPSVYGYSASGSPIINSGSASPSMYGIIDSRKKGYRSPPAVSSWPKSTSDSPNVSGDNSVQASPIARSKSSSPASTIHKSASNSPSSRSPGSNTLNSPKYQEYKTVSSSSGKNVVTEKPSQSKKRG